MIKNLIMFDRFKYSQKKRKWFLSYIYDIYIPLILYRYDLKRITIKKNSYV